MEDYVIELKEGVKPYHGRPYPIPKLYEQMLKEEIEHLVKAGGLRKVTILNGEPLPYCTKER